MPRKKRADGASKLVLKRSAGWQKVQDHPLLAALSEAMTLREHNEYARTGWAAVNENGIIYFNPKRDAEPEQWAYVFAHCLLQLGFGHFPLKRPERAWIVACDVATVSFLRTLKFGRAPEPIDLVELPDLRDPDRLLEMFRYEGVPSALGQLSTAGLGMPGCIENGEERSRYMNRIPDWTGLLRVGLSDAVVQAVEVASGDRVALGKRPSDRSNAERARTWFISTYPLMGALAASFQIVEDVRVCQRMNVSVAAVWPAMREIYVNPAAALDSDEACFVIAHELLHVGLRHDVRCGGRDPYLWNVACDYVINGWLKQMRIGTMPAFGALHDPELEGLSAEAIYDEIVRNLRRYRKLATLRGYGSGDVMNDEPKWWHSPEGMSLDAFYRRCLSQGLEYHQSGGRGLLPAGLVEEIQALSHSPIPWDVELARWFDRYFAPLERRRSYARPSRRQASTPDIPRPRYVVEEGAADGRTFGVILDTSGSMDRATLARALGAIASYAESRQVPAVRVVFADADVYDQGYMEPDAIAHRVRIKGRGGTVLQPAVNFLDRAKDFPRSAPLLIITDGYCDPLTIRREHGYLISRHGTLPPRVKGDVFLMDG